MARISYLFILLYYSLYEMSDRFLSVADLKVTQRRFNFGKKQGLPFYFVSAADGTNVVKV